MALIVVRVIFHRCTPHIYRSTRNSISTRLSHAEKANELPQSSEQNNLTHSNPSLQYGPSASQWSSVEPPYSQQHLPVQIPGANPSCFRPPLKKALLIGISYQQVSRQIPPLKSCHNDVLKVRDFLHWRGYNSITVLMDDGLYQQPTIANILNELAELVRDARPGDSLFLHYSGT